MRLARPFYLLSPLVPSSTPFLMRNESLWVPGPAPKPRNPKTLISQKDFGGKSCIVFLATFSIPTRERKIRDRREEGKKLELEFELRLLN